MDNDKKPMDQSGSTSDRRPDTKKCPNCGGTMKRDGNKWVCESCDHEIEIS